ncbi:patatin-like phospholipase family protein [Myxococcaceae bacterium GXIMD 01537]
MSIKSLLSSTTPTTRRGEPTPAPVKADKPNLLERLGEGIHKVAQGADRLADRFEAINPIKKPLSTQAPWEGITLTGKPLQIPVESLLKVDLGDVRKVLEKVFPPKVSDAEGKKLVAQTQGFRDTLGKVRSLGAELDMLPPSHPRHAEVKAALGRAEADLKAQSGYTRATAPRPGALWLDPQFLAKELPGGKLNASRFPTGTPVTKPPSPTDFVFGPKGQPTGRVITVGEGASARTVRTAAEYKAAVAARRAELGMPVKDGEPVGVHMSLEGGGGKGKRYAAMLSEMYDVGVVPTSFSGASAGAIAASVAAAGATPQQLSDLAKDPRLSKLYDLDLSPDDGGLLNGNAAFELIDSKLREITGITDRPVTFADLKVPLQIVAAKAYDSAVGPDGYKSAKDRVFVFSQETTPDTPVALAVRASMAIPAVFDPVQMVDPTTGRTMHLVDGGALDNLPIGYNKNDLPTVGVSLYGRASNHPQDKENLATPKPLPTGNVDSSHILWNAFNGYSFLKDSASSAGDFKDRTAPKANQYMLSVPTWDLNDPSREDSVLGFGYDAKVDPTLDQQTRQVTRDFLRNYIDDMRVPGHRGTNVTTQVPKDLRFNVPVTVKGERFQVSYAGGDSIVTTSASGKRTELKLGQQKIEAMYLDHLSFGDLSAQLAHAIGNPRGGLFDWLPF